MRRHEERAQGAKERPKAAPHERHLLRRAARWGSRGPEWWLAYGPPIFGWAAAACLPSARRAVQRNLRALRGPAPPWRDVLDVLATFGTYASCLAEVLSNDAPGGPKRPSALVVGEHHAERAVREEKGLVLVTAHTAGWDVVGPLLGDAFGLELVLVTQPEPDARARHLQDEARRRAGVSIAHVGDDPLASLPLLAHLRGGGVVALQLDRVPRGMRTRPAPVPGGAGVIPEGPLRLAQLSGAPILPVFSARRGHREYRVEIFAPRRLPRRATEAELDEAAAYLGRCMAEFLRAHPTQWFQFGGA